MATQITRDASQLTTGVERHVVRRGIAAVGLVSIALIHLLDVPGKFDELPYVGVLFVGLILTTLLLAEAMIRTDDLRVWLVAGAVSAATILGYAISRTSGLPRGQRRRRRQLDRATRPGLPAGGGRCRAARPGATRRSLHWRGSLT
jgi:hypothetical protein